MPVARKKQTSRKRATSPKSNQKIDLNLIELSYSQIVEDYRLAVRSRQASLLGRKEVMGGKAKFGIFGDGKEVAQLAMAKAFQPGDFRSGYYRDQTFAFASGISDIHQFFAQLYANPEVSEDPATAGRAMNAHFATRSLDDAGNWKNLVEMKNCSADISPTGSQMPRLVGLAYASRIYREVPELKDQTQFSNNGNEIAFGTIGNGTCAEGMFWEAVNAIGVLGAPAIISIWDDEYGISVTNEFQITKGNISELLQGFKRKSKDGAGYVLYRVKGWDYPELVRTYLQAARQARKDHTPSIIHVVELTQPQGHSTSGSHERYKSQERLQWEREHDCVTKMREWMLAHGVASEAQLDEYEAQDVAIVNQIRDESWNTFQKPIRAEFEEVLQLLDEMASTSSSPSELQAIRNRLSTLPYPIRRHIGPAVRDALIAAKDETGDTREKLLAWKRRFASENEKRFSSHLYSESAESALKVKPIKPIYSKNSKSVNGFELLNACFEAALSRDPRVIAFGEDVGFLGGVNQGFRGMQAKYGALRVSDTGIRECTIVGQAIGLALRGLRPIAEIQYLDYVLYALQILSDDLATLHWRTKGGQKAPVIIRTRGHRLEGIWHSGSPMAAMIHLLRGMHVLVPRDMTQAAGFYNTLLKSDDPGIIVEVLNGYRIKEVLPDNIGEFTLPLGVPEILREGSHITIVTYGACCRLAMDAASSLAKVNISAEIIDAQSLLPFDINHRILESLKKTNRIIFVDEDVPGGGTAYMMQEVLENQEGYQYLDSPPRTITAKPHRPAFGSDGDYFSKPTVEQIFETACALMNEADPASFPLIF